MKVLITPKCCFQRELQNLFPNRVSKHTVLNLRLLKSITELTGDFLQGYLRPINCYAWQKAP